MSSTPISRTGHDVTTDDVRRRNGAVGAETSVLADLLARGVRVRVRVTGKSMHPTICSSDRVTIAPVDAAAIRRGDILLIQDETGHLKLHRLIRIRRQAERPYLTRGDALITPDLPVAAVCVLGRVSLVERGGTEGESGRTGCLPLWLRPARRGFLGLGRFWILAGRSARRSWAAVRGCRFFHRP